MLKFLKIDPTARLEKEVARKLEAARDAQRSGRIPEYAALSAEAEALGRQLDELRGGTRH